MLDYGVMAVLIIRSRVRTCKTLSWRIGRCMFSHCEDQGTVREDNLSHRLRTSNIPQLKAHGDLNPVKAFASSPSFHNARPIKIFRQVSRETQRLVFFIQD